LSGQHSYIAARANLRGPRLGRRIKKEAAWVSRLGGGLGLCKREEASRSSQRRLRAVRGRLGRSRAKVVSSESQSARVSMHDDYCLVPI
jgi:hypothetical protein